MATNYSNTEEATKKIEEIFAQNQAAQTTAEQQTTPLNQATEASYRERQLQGSARHRTSLHKTLWLTKCQHRCYS